jgi:hypothetical protein
MKYLDCSSREIEIPSLKEDEDGFFLVECNGDLELLIKGMGWYDFPHFESETKCVASTLIGRWFHVLAAVNCKERTTPSFLDRPPLFKPRTPGDCRIKCDG